MERCIQTPAFTPRTGPTTVMNAEKNELDFVSLIFIPEILSILVAQTNLYAMQLQQKLGQINFQTYNLLTSTSPLLAIAKHS
jgi:hypothetical protein